MTDLLLAIVHHILAFGLLAMLMAERMLLRPGCGPVDVSRLSRLDLGYGISAVLLVIVGVCRLLFGAKGLDFYTGNPWFWAKMVCFGLIAALSLPPTIRFLGWRKALVGNPHFVPAEAELKLVRLMLALEVGLFLGVIVCAAAMARWGAF